MPDFLLMAKKKRTKQSQQVGAKKQSRISEDVDISTLTRPVWSFSQCDTRHERWAFDHSRINEVLFEKMQNFENQTWHEIKVKGKRNNHHVQINQLCKEAQKRLSELHKEDYDALFSLRLSGRERLWGIIQDGVFMILWYDKEHEVCPSHLSHT
ncbi:hypothetical protein ACKQTC_07070 [Peptococcus simiae]|uniref:Uncharacterized protein n=1 Tax=Peptococcus simiae TaxID=1643805 RepID=A0ABW9H0A9_9FIRM